MLGFGWLKKKTKDSAEYGKKVVGTDDIKKSTDEIVSLANRLLNPKAQAQNAKKETFVEAKKRLNVNDIDLIKTYKNMVYSFYVSILFASLCFVGTIYQLFLMKQIMAGFSMIAILAICLANAFRFSFRAFQIKHQKLCSAQEWWNRPNEWFPKI